MLLSSTRASAQNTGARGEIRGRVVNSSSRSAVTTATVEVTLVSATSSSGRIAVSAAGTFRFQGLRPGRYHALIRALGYMPVEVRAIEITTTSPQADLGTVAL